MKLLYAVGVWAVGFLLNKILGAVPSTAMAVLSSAVEIALFLYAARIFRGREEALDAARPWWQMTAKPKLSRVVGILLAVGVGLEILAWLYTLLPARPGRPQSTLGPSSVITGLEWALLAFLYLNSWRQLSVRSGRALRFVPLTPKRRAPLR